MLLLILTLEFTLFLRTLGLYPLSLHELLLCLRIKRLQSQVLLLMHMMAHVRVRELVKILLLLLLLLLALEISYATNMVLSLCNRRMELGMRR